MNIPSKQFVARNRRLARHGQSYEEYLNSSIWIKLRTQLRNEKQYQTCFCCSSPQHIHLHHVSYVNMYNPSIKKQKQKIVALCRFCHEQVHELVNTKKLGLRQACKHVKRHVKRALLKRIDG